MATWGQRKQRECTGAVLGPYARARNGEMVAYRRHTDLRTEMPPWVWVKFHLEDLKGPGAHISPIGNGNRGWIGKRNGELSGSKQLHVEPGTA